MGTNGFLSEVYQYVKIPAMVVSTGVLNAKYFFTLKNRNIRNIQSPVLFICKGNICRSPFAEEYFKSLLEKRGFDVDVQSAGLDTENGRTCPDEAISAAISFGLDLKRHRSKQLDSQLIQKSNLIICMQFSQFFEIIKRFPEAKDKCRLLKHYSGISFDMNIYDPFGKDKVEFISCYREIAECLDTVIQIIVSEDTKLLKLKICET
jgi:protein-tyrosine phosphatase